ncbi:MAG: hypothetical protein KatS3mg009_2937 [Acidimicrobiia bacterium]|nr:MAG: hypothetical protein KatS3mg009_2937 [Acidimicrobiia bacterium]
MLLDPGPLVGIERVERVRAEEGLGLVAPERPVAAAGAAVTAERRAHRCTPASISAARSRSSPDRILLFTVPSGCSSNTATSRYV